MGNTASTDKKSLEHVVNYLVANYITKENFETMKNLAQPEYCDDLVILTSKILNKYLDPKVIEYLAVRKGIEGENLLQKEKIVGISKKKLEEINLDIPLKRRRICVGLAKHYVQIAHIFSAISSTLNPEYKFKDDDNNVIRLPTTEKSSIPDDTNKEITRNNLCSNRLKILIGNININQLNESDNITINPNFCNSNNNSEGNASVDVEAVKNLLDEPGIKELKQLYYDIYDFETGEFNKMSPEMEEKYDNDLKTLYKTFSGNSELPKNEVTGESLIKNFSDIKLKDFFTSEGCKSGAYKIPVSGNPDFGLFQKYAENIQSLIKNIKTYNEKLLDILDNIFVFNIDPNTNKKHVLLNPDLNDELLTKLTIQTRKIIIELYTDCEEKFVTGLTIYEKIIKKQKLLTSKSQIQNLKKTIEERQILSTNKQIETPVSQVATEQPEATPEATSEAAPPASTPAPEATSEAAPPASPEAATATPEAAPPASPPAPTATTPAPEAAPEAAPTATPPAPEAVPPDSQQKETPLSEAPTEEAEISQQKKEELLGQLKTAKNILKNVTNTL